MTVSNLSGSGVPQAREKILRSVGPEEALRMMQARDDVIFLDVRTPQERSHGAIPGSKLVSIYALLKGEVPLPKDKPILLVCAVGGRSYVAAQVLSKNGYREVYNLSGGVQGWYRAGLPLMYDKAAVTH
jgi:rhodanese-related sulfurtransferase